MNANPPRTNGQHVWPARRYLEAANQPPVTDDDIERWMEEDAERTHSVYRTRLIGYGLVAVLLLVSAAAYLATRP